MIELNLRFSSAEQLIVGLEGQSSGAIAFSSPFADDDLQELRWYIETYATAYITDVDDDRAGRILQRLQPWGTALFEAVFESPGAYRLFEWFLQQPERVLTISAMQPEILALPWELLHVPDGAYLLSEELNIAIRRNLTGEGGDRNLVRIIPKAQLRLLFVVSRPAGAGFIDPRSDGLAVIAALANTGRVTVEFLRPATLHSLEQRLADEGLPQVDILHFDGHGVFDATQNVGYLLFENVNGGKDLVSAEQLGQLLTRQGLGLVVLSACQSAMTAGEEAIGSVAARLTKAGVRSVVAMSYSVLVKTTEQLFSAFYQALVQGRGVGEALDRARRQLMGQPDRGERQRGQDRVMLRVADWFVPTLYQVGRDGALMRPEGAEPEQRELLSNLPDVPSSGFWGRQRELWRIERAFTDRGVKRRETRRLTIAGFGGQGKTALAQEAGRWLLQTGMFGAVCFVDYASFQGRDAVGWAVSTIGTVLEQNLIDESAVERALEGRSTLIILDNLEDVQPEENLQELLTVAKGWSEAGRSRVLLTTRQMEWTHPDYPSGGSWQHELIRLNGLSSEQVAIEYFQALMALPPVPEVGLPGRSALVDLFKLVDWHPLSIKLVAEQLRSRRATDVGEALERLLAEVPTDQDKDRSLIASLNLSLERLDERSRDLVRRLGVFEGGAVENVLMEVTELTAEQWQPLRTRLMAAGLIQPEIQPGVEYSYLLKLHPTLARVLWMQLSEAEQEHLKQRHRRQYYNLADWLYGADRQTPQEARAIALRELPNLLMAVRRALAAGEEWGGNFANAVNHFLNNFGMNRDRAELIALAEAAAAAIGSQTWFLARGNEGERLLNSGQPLAAAQVFQTILQELEDAPSYERCLVLQCLGQCDADQGRLEQAAQWYGQELAELKLLEASVAVKRQMGIVQNTLGDVLRDMGQVAAARQAYEEALMSKGEVGDQRGMAVTNAQLGSLAILARNLPEAERRYRKALSTFQILNEPATEAVAWHQLGIVYQNAQLWESAEQAYREAAQIHKAQGNLARAAKTWAQLAVAMHLAEKPREAEEWYRKAIADSESAGDRVQQSVLLKNLAYLLRLQPHRLSEARSLAEAAIAIAQTLDPAATEIWNTYQILVDITTRQNDLAQAQVYRRLEQQTHANYAGTKHQLQQLEGSIQACVAAVEDRAVRQQLEEGMPQEGADAQNFFAVLQLIWAGERDEERLCELLNHKAALIVREVLRRIGK